MSEPLGYRKSNKVFEEADSAVGKVLFGRYSKEHAMGHESGKVGHARCEVFQFKSRELRLKSMRHREKNKGMNKTNRKKKKKCLQERISRNKHKSPSGSSRTSLNKKKKKKSFTIFVKFLHMFFHIMFNVYFKKQQQLEEVGIHLVSVKFILRILTA